MTETTPAPAEQAVQSGTSALDAEAIAPTHFIPKATQDNYAQIARDQAALRGSEPKAVMQEFAEQWLQMHERQPLDGYDHLAAWAKDFDPAADEGPSGLAILQARVIESARRDPYQAVIGDQAAVEQGVTAQRAQDAAIGNATSAPSVDPASGYLPAAGVLPIPAEVTVGQPGAEVAQGDPSPGVDTPDDGAGAPSSPPPSPPSSSDSSSSESGKSSGKSSSSGSSS
jgi:hypothetical protein